MKLKYTSALVILILTISISCQNRDSLILPELDEAFSIRLGNELSLQTDELTIAFTDVPSDSRCPEEVECFWAGNAEVIFLFNNHAVTLNTYFQPKDSVISGFNIKLLSLNRPKILSGQCSEIHLLSYTVDFQANRY